MRFHKEGRLIRWLPRKYAVSRGQSFGKTAQGPIRNRKSVISIGVARIEVDGAAPLRNRVVPMPNPALDKGDRFDNINVIGKILFSLLEFRERTCDVIATRLLL